jgi:hypothetical protein
MTKPIKVKTLRVRAAGDKIELVICFDGGHVVYEISDLHAGVLVADCGPLVHVALAKLLHQRPP